MKKLFLLILFVIGTFAVINAQQHNNWNFVHDGYLNKILIRSDYENSQIFYEGRRCPYYIEIKNSYNYIVSVNAVFISTGGREVNKVIFLNPQESKKYTFPAIGIISVNIKFVGYVKDNNFYRRGKDGEFKKESGV